MRGPEIRAYIVPFSSLLEEIVPENISPDAYFVSYLTHLIAHKRYYLEIYADLLGRALPGKKTSLLDCGSGNGLLGIFAKFCGWKKVVLNDVSESFLRGSRVLAQRLGVHVDGFVLGELQHLLPQLKGERLDILVGTDVVEHIYDLEDFLHAAADLGFRSVLLTTAANSRNLWKARQARRIQVKDERNDYENRRYTIIAFAQPALSTDDIRRLARLTRGLKREDILKVVATYSESGQWPPPPAHPTNTCDPETGSWTERLLPFKKYRLLFQKAGFNLKIDNGFYNSYRAGLRPALLRLVNALVRRNRRLGHYLSSYIVLEARPMTS